MKSGWPVLAAATFSCGLGMSAIVGYTTGLFLPALSEEIGLTKTMFGLSYLLWAVGLAIGLPAVGALVDRYGVVKPVIVSAIAFSACYLALALLPLNIPLFLGMYPVIAILGVCTTPIIYSRVVASWFVEQRGLAFGILQAGISIVAGTALPPLVVAAMSQWGWRSGYMVIAGAGLLVVPVVLGLLRLRPGDAERSRGAPAIPFREIIAVRPFKLMIVAFTSLSMMIPGMLLLFVSMLREAGVGQGQAALYASLIGVSAIGSRLFVGWLADRLFAPWIIVAAGLVLGAGCLVLAFGGPALAPVAAVAIGVALGSETDLLAFLTARYFGLHAFARAYSLQYASMMLTGGLSPVWMGAVADRVGGFGPVLMINAALSLVVAALFLAMPRYDRTDASAAEA